MAAGRSSRMGRPKMLLRWGETTILGHLVCQWQRLGSEQIAVVHGPDEAIESELDRLSIGLEHRIVNLVPERGMFSSIQCAAEWDQWKKALTHWVIVLGDQPHLRESTLRGLIDFAQAHADAVCQPEWKERPKHPVVLPKPVFEKLKSSTCSDLKEFLNSSVGKEPLLFQVDDPGLELDIDYPEDYERLKAKRRPDGD